VILSASGEVVVIANQINILPTPMDFIQIMSN
jgi:hypothetical protein